MAYSAQMKAKYFKHRAEGLSMKASAEAVGINPNTATIWERATPTNRKARDMAVDQTLPIPGTFALTHEALLGLEDFAYWRWRYLGRRSTAWQTEAAQQVVEWLASDRTELIVVNCPPGSGKSTLFAHDIPAWLICRDRTIRILIGSASANMARKYVNRIKQLLQRTRPLGENPGENAKAVASLAREYGRFRPTYTEIWRADEFTVISGADERLIEDKESTCTAYGRSSEFLGDRANFVIWDDLVTDKNPGPNPDNIQAQRDWWEKEGETRVEPGGCLILQGQRLGPDDLYRYALDQRRGGSSASRYKHILYPAHFEDRCKGDHGTADDEGEQVTRPLTAYPKGCLLDPVRLPWYGSNGLLTIQQNREQKYRVLYQQEELDPTDVLIPRVWIDGGTDHNGIERPGCWDNHRTLCQAPRGLSQPWYSIATADPSPTQYWAVEWWVYHPASHQRFLLDLERRKMDAPDFLDWNDNMGQFYGIMEEWQARSELLGMKIQTWIIEVNACQRWLLQYDHTKRWQRFRHVDILPHATGINKLSPEFGIQMLKEPYRHGNVRLPRGDRASEVASEYLAKEAVRYGVGGATDDCLMAQWFFEHNLEKLSKPKQEKIPRLARPSWMRAPVLAP